jgi:hypothetical protein
MSYAIYGSDLHFESTAAPRLHFRTRDVAVLSDGLGAFRGLMLAVPLGAGMWVGLYYLVRVFI